MQSKKIRMAVLGLLTLVFVAALIYLAFPSAWFRSASLMQSKLYSTATDQRGPSAEESLTPAPGEATIVRKSDGTARVIFQPRTGLKTPVEAYSRDGKKLGKVTWQALFEVEVKEKALADATTPNGIDLEKLLQGVGALRQLDNGAKMIRAEVPYAVQDPSSREIIASGSEAYFPLGTFVEERSLTPVGARPSDPADTVTRDRAAAFNDRLAESGVVADQPPQRPRGSPVERAHAPPRSGGNDSGGRVPRSSSYADSLRFLSPPTCDCPRGGRSCLYFSHFGYRPSFRANHSGIDISAGTGTPIRAAADGCVKRQTVGEGRKGGGGWGNSVMLDHGDGVETHYAHMSKFAKGLTVGLCYKRGDLIGYVGETGFCTGPHLHFGVYLNGVASDPHRFMRAKASSDLNMSCSELAQYNEDLTKNRSDELRASFDQIVAFAQQPRTKAKAPAARVARAADRATQTAQ